MKIIAIHQPNYFPWLGYFYKIFAADNLIFLDDVAYSKGSYTARTPCRKQKGQIHKSYLTVPIKKCKLGTLIKGLIIDHDQGWIDHHLNYIENMYRKAPFFDTYFPEIKIWMATAPQFNNLAGWNIYLIQKISTLLDLKANFILASDVLDHGNGTSYLIDLIQALNGDLYLSGIGGQKYHEETLFHTAEIQLMYHDIYQFLEGQMYKQYQGDWLNGLSILDSLMNIGADAITELFNKYHQV